MLKRRALVLFMVVLMLALPVVAAAASAVEFEDDNLQAAVIKEFENLGKVVEKSKIPQADMKLLKKLFANGEFAAGLGGLGADGCEVIRDLTGLEYALKLEVLDVSGNYIKDLAPIRNLPLSFLSISWNDTQWDAVEGDFAPGTPAFSYNPSSPQMKILQEIQHRGAVVHHSGLVKRISGPDRYQTAIRIWQNMYTSPSDDEKVVRYNPGNTIVLARGDDFADALVGAPLAYALGTGEENDFVPAPILLTTSDKLHPTTKNALIKYIEDFEKELIKAGGVFDVYVLGGTTAINEVVVRELIYAIETEFDALDVRAIRLGGEDRYETSVEIAKKLSAIQKDNYTGNNGGWPGWDEIIFASGENFPDALSAAPYAEREGMPILLTKGDSLPACVADYLKSLQDDINKAVVAGGAAAISENVLSQLVKLQYRKSGANSDVFGEVTRVWGADRYATSVELGKHYGALDEDGKILTFPGRPGDENGHSFVATGEDFADALTGAVLAAQKETGILLVKKDTVPGPVEKAMDFQSSTTVTSYLTILGGESAITLHNAVKMYNLVRPLRGGGSGGNGGGALD